MGAGQSARKLTITNEEELGVIHISSGVAQRLAQGIGNANKEAGSTAAGGDPNARLGAGSPSSSAKHQATQDTVYEPVHSAPVPTPAYSAQLPQEYTMSALKMEQLKEAELRNQDIYWQKRLENLKANHAKIDKILEEEYQRAIDQVSGGQGKKKIDINSVMPPCIDNKDKVLRCYQDHPREILKCSTLVEEFNNCVDERRGRLIAARC